MPIARVTSKRQVTTSSDAPHFLGTKQRDDLIPMETPEQLERGRAGKKLGLYKLYGSLPATRPFPGKKEVRESVGRELGEALRKETC